MKLKFRRGKRIKGEAVSKKKDVFFISMFATGSEGLSEFPRARSCFESSYLIWMKNDKKEAYSGLVT